MKDESLWGAEEVAEYLDLSPDTVYRYMRRGIIPYVRPAGRNVRFRPEEIVEWVKQSRNAKYTEGEVK